MQTNTKLGIAGIVLAASFYAGESYSHPHPSQSENCVYVCADYSNVNVYQKGPALKTNYPDVNTIILASLKVSGLFALSVIGLAIYDNKKRPPEDPFN